MRALFAGSVAAVAWAVAGGLRGAPEIRTPAQGAQAPAPSLVVVIVIDQLRHDLIERYRTHLSEGGFARFLQDGARFTNARYLHGTTDTCPGHAVISTGTWGAENGIVANAWHEGQGGPATGCSDTRRTAFARKLLRPTIGDVLKRARGAEARVIAATGKRASAQVLGGTSADGVFWPGKSGHYATWQGEDAALPAWVRAFNASGRVEAYSYRTWHRLLPEAAYAMLGPDDDPAERGPGGRRARFPHVLAGGTSRPGSMIALHGSPFSDELLAEFAIAAIHGEGLGDDEVTDYLALGFSASDAVAHAFGPDSHESMDTILRLDRQLERLLEAISRQVGDDRVLVVLTADHGVAPLPEVAARHAWGGSAGRILEQDIDTAVERALTAEFGSSPSGRWLAFHDFPNVYLDQRALRASGVALAEAERAARDAVTAVPGIRRAFTRGELTRIRKAGTATPMHEAVLRSFHPQRSGNVVYQVNAYRVVADRGSNHGSDWDYDARVPLMWLGPAVRPGEYRVAASPVDIAPTIFAVLGVEDPGTSGRALREMLHAAPHDAPAANAGP
jgi:arylsulfatase A-like enzyme